MKRWFVFFFLVATIAAVASFGGFSDSSAVGETAGAVGTGKILFLSMLALAGLGFAGWMIYASRKQRMARRSRRDAAPGPSFDPGTRSDEQASRSR